MKNIFKLIEMTAIAAFMLVICGGNMFAQNLQKKPQNWSSFIRAGTTNSYWTSFDTVLPIKVIGASSPCVELKNGKMETVRSNPTGGVNNMAKIKTTSNQQVEFVTWIGPAKWDSLKAKNGMYWRLEPNSELVFEYHDFSGKGKITGFYLKSGTLSVDMNYNTIGEAVEFAETIAKTIKYSKIKTQVEDWKNVIRYSGWCLIPSCVCRGDLTQHVINQYADDATFWGAILGALPPYLALPAEYMGVMPQYRQNAALAYAVACAYGKFPTQKEFELHLLDLLSGVDISQVRSEQFSGMAGVVRDEFIEKAATAIAKTIAPSLVSVIPGAGNAVGAVVGAVTGRSAARTFGNKARDFYKP